MEEEYKMSTMVNKKTLKEYFEKQLGILGVKDEVIVVCDPSPPGTSFVPTRKMLFSDYLVESYGTT